MNQNLMQKIKNFVLNDIQLGESEERNSNDLWKKIKNTGSEIWRDTGDMEEASKLWCAEMSASTL